MNTHDIIKDNEYDVAVVGMSGRFPGAKNIEEYWQNLTDGVESITFFTDEQLREAGVDETTINNPNYIKAAPILPHDAGEFDAAFFGYSPREAQMMDPQHRLFLECAWQALEHAGYNAPAIQVPVGIFGGAAMNTYFMYSGMIDNFATEFLPTLIGNDNSFLTTRVSYKLNLKGPSVTVQTACSTALVAVHQAYQSLLNEECDMALAGAVSVRIPHEAGYFYEEGSVATPDGHCRTFDAAAKGTLFGSGVGMVVLKRLTDALEDKDTIYAVIKGSAINNDGSAKLDYTAPSVSSQSDVVAEALSSADVTADTISYIEAHGTGTFLGDPVELAALTKAFRHDTDDSGYCAIGSVKTNIGHLDAAAGMAGLIKTILALRNRQIPATLHYKTPNPQIDFANTPFYVNDKLSDWPAQPEHPRRAGVTALGIGGTNAHIILEEAPQPESSGESREHQLLLLSARTKTGLETAVSDLASHLQTHPDLPLADIAYTLQTGRKRFKHRRIVVARNREEAVAQLNDSMQHVGVTAVQDAGQREAIFMFSGQGSQYVNMGKNLYENEPIFREVVDECARLLHPHLDRDIRDLLFPKADETAAAEQLKQTRYTQPALFTIEYAMAQLWLAWGIEPVGMVGHSIGEYIAACLSGVFTLADGLALVAKRGALMQSMPPGSMLAVLLPEEEVRPYLNGNLSLAVINADGICVVAGEHERVDRLEAKLEAQDVMVRRLRTSHAFHSEMMSPILADFTEVVGQIQLNAPKRPFVSNVTGNWITNDEATDPAYWANHLRNTVRFNDCLNTLLQGEQYVFIEVGPGKTLADLVRQHRQKTSAHAVITSLRHPKDSIRDDAHMLRSLGQAWMAELDVAWDSFYENETRQRIALPTYPFEPKRHWYKKSNLSTTKTIVRRADKRDWIYVPSWKRLPLLQTAVSSESWLLFEDDHGVARQLAALRTAQQDSVTRVRAGNRFAKQPDGSYTIDPVNKTHIRQLLEATSPTQIIHFAHLETGNATDAPVNVLQLLALAQAVAEQSSNNPLRITVVGSRLADVHGGEPTAAHKTLLSGPLRVIPKEMPHVNTQLIDLLPTADPIQSAQQVLAETAVSQPEPFVAYRNGHRWVQTFEAVKLNENANSLIRQQGTYLITGGFGGIGGRIAQHLAETVQANLVLVSRTQMPPLTELCNIEDNGTAAKIKQVQKLEEAGSSVLPLTADVSNETQLRAAIQQATEKFGRIDGIIHAAGLVQDGVLQLKSSETAVQVLAPKVTGTQLLHKLTAQNPPDFMLLFSSINSVLAPAGQFDYSAANAFMDAFARQQAGGQTAVISVGWPGWQEVGILSNLPDSRWKQDVLAAGVSPEDGIELFEQAVSQTWPHLIVSPVPFEPLPARALATEAVEISPPISTRHSAQADVKNGIYKTEAEAVVAALWEEFLGVERPLPAANYFDLGGSSLIALRMFAKVEEQYGIKLPLATLIEAPTLAELAAILQPNQSTNPNEAVIEKEEAERKTAVWTPSWSALVKIQDNGSGKPPLFLMHGAGGNILIYRDLARHLDPDQPVYGLQSVGLNENAQPHTTIEQMATHYLEQIQTIQPHGPYLLGGYCMGGTIAFEIALQLQQQGQPVGLLALLETYNWANVSQESVFGDFRFYFQKVQFHLQNLLMLDRSKRDLFFSEKWNEAKRRTRMWLGKQDDSQAQVVSAARLWEINDDAAWKYDPQPYNGQILHIVAKSEYSRYAGFERSWEPIAKEGVTLTHLPFYPAGMLIEPFVAQLAQTLRKNIHEALSVNQPT